MGLWRRSTLSNREDCQSSARGLPSGSLSGPGITACLKSQDIRRGFEIESPRKVVISYRTVDDYPFGGLIALYCWNLLFGVNLFFTGSILGALKGLPVAVYLSQPLTALWLPFSLSSPIMADVPLYVVSDYTSSERRITPSWTITQLKSKLEPITGIPPLCQQIYLKISSDERILIQAVNEDAVHLSSFPLAPYAELQVC
jgi:hypothetical protein